MKIASSSQPATAKKWKMHLTSAARAVFPLATVVPAGRAKPTCSALPSARKSRCLQKGCGHDKDVQNPCCLADLPDRRNTGSSVGLPATAERRGFVVRRQYQAVKAADHRISGARPAGFAGTLCLVV